MRPYGAYGAYGEYQHMTSGIKKPDKGCPWYVEDQFLLDFINL